MGRIAIKDDLMKWVLLGILTLTWGSSFYLIKKGVEVFSPLDVGALRITFAGVVLCVFLTKHIKRIPRDKVQWVLLSGLCGNFIPMFLFPLAEVHLESAIAGILNSMVPLFVLLLGYFIFGIPYTRKQSLGAVIGFVGVVVLMLFGAEAQGRLHLPSALLVLLATTLYATSGLIIKKYLTTVPAFSLSVVIFSLMSVPTLLFLVVHGFFDTLTFTPATISGLIHVAILGILGTAVAMILFYLLIQRVSAVFASSVTYLMPIVAMSWGMLDGERLHLVHIVGVSLILWGVYMIREKKVV